MACVQLSIKICEICGDFNAERERASRLKRGLFSVDE